MLSTRKDHYPIQRTSKGRTMKRLITLLFFAFFAITTQAQTVPNLPSGTLPFGTQLWRAPDGDIWTGNEFEGYTNLGNWQRVADSLGVKINWSDTTIIASKEWVEGKLNSLPPSGVLTVTGDGVDNTDPANPVISYPDPADIGALAPGDNVSELTNDAGYLDSETDPVYSGDPASSITQNDIDAWDAKQDAITGAATTVVSSNLTPSRALISNGSGKIAVSPVSSTELAFLDGVSSNVQDQLDAKIPLAQKGASDGVAPLGPDGKVPNNYLNFTGYTPKGSWDASTNTPTLADGAGTIGWVYTVSVAGTQDLGSGSVSYNVGDRVVYTADNIWVKEENTQLVVSVNGYQGVVNLNKADVGLGNVDNTSDLDKPISNAVQDALDLKLDASEISNYYTKTQMQTSGQAAVHWDNITGMPNNYITNIPTSIQGLNSFGGDVDTIAGTSFGYFNTQSTNTPISGNAFVAITGTRDAGGVSSNYGFRIMGMVTGTGLGDDALFYKRLRSGVWGNTYRVASREWVNSLPGLVPQTLSLGAGAGNIGISGGNSVSLNSLIYNLYQDHDAHTLAGFYPRRNETGSTGYPSANGGGVRFVRSSNSFSGAFEFWKNSGNDGELYFNVGTGTDTWKGFERVASKEHVAGNYVTLGTAQTITGVKTLTGSAIPIRLQAADLAIYIPFLASDGTTRKGYIGFPTTSPNDIFINNDAGGLLKVKSGVNGLTYGYGSGDKTVWHEGNLDPATVAPETVISTTVNFTIDWQNDTAPGSGGKTYAEVHGNHFTYSAFYEDGSGAEVNYSPAVKITRSGGNITTVQFGDIQTGNIVIK